MSVAAESELRPRRGRAERPSLPRMPLWKALLLSLPLILLMAMLPMLALQMGDPLYLIAGLTVWIGSSVLFVLMLVTGRTHRYRSILFIATAVALPLDFIPWMIGKYGSMMLTDEIIYSGGASFCPLTMPMVLIPAFLKRVVIFPGQLVGEGTHGIFAGMAILWLGTSLALGRGYCSWGCFYGGWDDMFSQFPKKARIKDIDRRWIYAPFGVLLGVALLSALTYSPVYCEWLCPFKAITEFAAPTTALIVVQTVIFGGLFAGVVVALPLLTKRRTQCALLCPFGALQSFFNKINIFEVRIDTEQCTQCERCLRSCPTFSLDKQSLQSGKTLITCTKCAQCIDTCPRGAIAYHIKGTRLKASPQVARVLFVYPAFVLLSFIGGSTVINGLYRLLRLITTGSMLY